jgi:hypothetical protein
VAKHKLHQGQVWRENSTGHNHVITGIFNEAGAISITTASGMKDLDDEKEGEMWHGPVDVFLKDFTFVSDPLKAT